MTQYTSWRRVLVLATAAAVAVAATWAAKSSLQAPTDRASQERAAATPNSAANSAPQSAAGVRVAIEPETGDLVMPTAADAAKLGAPQEPLAPPVLEFRPDGSQSMHLNGNYQSYSVARIGPDGRIDTNCAQDADHAGRLLKSPAPTPATAPEVK